MRKSAKLQVKVEDMRQWIYLVAAVLVPLLGCALSYGLHIDVFLVWLVFVAPVLGGLLGKICYDEYRKKNYVVRKVAVAELIPVSAREVKLRWVKRSLFLVVAFLTLIPLWGLLFVDQKKYPWLHRTDGFDAIIPVILGVCILLLMLFLTRHHPLRTVKRFVLKHGATPKEVMDRQITDREERERKCYGDDYDVVCRRFGVFVNEERGRMYVGDKSLKFGEIVGYAQHDNSRIETKTTQTTLYSGSYGTGSTADGDPAITDDYFEESVRYETSEREIHNYTIAIKTSNPAQKVVRIGVGENEYALDEITATLDMIINNNQNG